MKFQLNASKVLRSTGIEKDGLFMFNVGLRCISSMMVMAKSVLCRKCSNLRGHGCATVKRFTPSLSDFACNDCEGNIGMTVKQEQRLCSEVKMVDKFLYAIEGCEVPVTL